jgi:hypothetical protein
MKVVKLAVTLAVIIGSSANASITIDWGAHSILPGKSVNLAVYDSGLSSAEVLTPTFDSGIQSVVFDELRQVWTVTAGSVSYGKPANVTFTAPDGSTYLHEMTIIQPQKPETYTTGKVEGVCDFHGPDAKDDHLRFEYSPSVVDTITVNEGGGPSAETLLQTTRKVTFLEGTINGQAGEKLDIAGYFTTGMSAAWVPMSKWLWNAADRIPGIEGNAAVYGSVSSGERGQQSYRLHEWNYYEYHTGSDITMTFDEENPRSGTYSYYMPIFDAATQQMTEYTGGGSFYCSFNDKNSDDVRGAIDAVEEYIRINGTALSVEVRQGFYARLSVATNLDQVAQIKADVMVAIPKAELRVRRTEIQADLNNAVIDADVRRTIQEHLTQASTMEKVELVALELQRAISGFDSELGRKVAWIQATLDRTPMSGSDRANIQARIDAITTSHDIVGLRHEIRLANERYLEGEHLTGR